MKKIILLLMITGQVAISQNTFTLTPDGLRNTENLDQNFVVLNYEGKTQSELYTDFLSKITNTYVSAKNVVSKVDNNIISINGYSTNAIARNNSAEYDINYNISFEFKDGRVRINAPQVLNMTTGKAILTISGESSALFSRYAIYKKEQLKDEFAKESLESFFNNLISEIAFTQVDEW